MLVLSRRPNERLFIGDKVSIKVVAINKGRVQLGIDAPRELPVHREEVFNTIKARKEMPTAPESA